MVKEISCKRASIDCEFLIRSDDTPELVDFVQEHCSEQHGDDVSEADLREQSVEVWTRLEAFVGTFGRINGRAAEFNQHVSTPPSSSSKLDHTWHSTKTN